MITQSCSFSEAFEQWLPKKKQKMHINWNILTLKNSMVMDIIRVQAQQYSNI